MSRAPSFGRDTRSDWSDCAGEQYVEAADQQQPRAPSPKCLIAIVAPASVTGRAYYLAVAEPNICPRPFMIRCSASSRLAVPNKIRFSASSRPFARAS